MLDESNIIKTLSLLCLLISLLILLPVINKYFIFDSLAIHVQFPPDLTCQKRKTKIK